MWGRRQSGEIVNATLLEVFLALTFLVLAVVQESVRVEVTNEAEIRRLRDSLGMLSDSLARLEAELAMRKGELLELRFNSRFPPDCPGVEEGEVAAVAIGGGDSVEVSVLSSRLGFAKGERRAMPTRAFPSTFEPFRAFGREHGCRFRVRIIDSDAATKREYIRAMSAVVGIFYTTGSYRDVGEQQ